MPTTGVRLAGFWRRAGAVTVDFFILALAEAPLTVDDHAIGVFPVLLLLDLAYHLFFWCKYGATPGKFILGLRVIDAESGERLTRRRATLRFFGYFVSSYATFGVGFLWMIRDEDKQCVHDKMARSLVVIASSIPSAETTR